MKKIILSALAIGFYVFSFSQSKTIDPKITKDKNGIVQSVEYPDSIDKSKIPSSSIDFINEFIKPSENEYFILEPSKDKKKDFKNEHYDQYFKGIKVEGAGYNFHYKNGKLFYAHGHYFKIGNLSVAPSITEEKAKDCFVEYKNIPIDSVTGYVSELLIKNVSDEQNPLPQLVYKIYLYANHENNNEIGYIDAHSCKVLLTEPSILDWAATGTFTTRYSGTRQAITQNYTGAFHLADSTRGAIIHTWNLNGSTNIQNRIELSDNDNNWTAAEHSANENDMGLDVHWSLQQIYTRLNNVHGINSFNNNGFAIDAHIRYGTTNNDRDNAGWNPTLNLLVFGDGAVNFRPVASIDAVAHEFGHGITDFQIGWGVTGDPRAFHEGLSDIWGAILESRIRPNSTWQIGEQITLNHACLRNLQNTNDPNAMQPIANTFGSSQYNSGDSYVRSGVLSHWFYLLVNGGSGTNDVGNVYTVYGMGMDVAEDLIVEAVFNNFLDNTTTYAGLRTGMINAATALCGANSLLVRQVENAWYAVGVGNQSTQPSISGSNLVCSSGSTFSVSNLPTGCTVQWSSGSYLTIYSGQNSNSCTFKSTGSGSSWIQAVLVSGCGNVTLLSKSVWSGIPSIPTSILGFCCNGMEFGSESEYTFTVNHPTNQGVNMYNWVVAGGTILTGQGTKTITVKTAKVTGSLKKYFDVSVRVGNSCGWSSYLWRSGYVTSGVGPAMFSIYPNPADNEITISVTDAQTISETDVTNEVVTVGDVKIYDSFGTIKKIKKTNTNQKSITVNVSDLQKGTYLILINSGTITESHKLIIE